MASQASRNGVRLSALAAVVLQAVASAALAQTLPLPPREAAALSGSEFVERVKSMPREDREERVLAQVLRGNVPEFLRSLVPITVNAVIEGMNHTATYYVTPDYLAIGSNEDYFLCPMTPIVAQRICDALNCTLPTRRMVNQIWSNATVKLSPAPIPPGPDMIKVPVFHQHNSMVRKQRSAQLNAHPLGELVAGDKKDVVISPRIYSDFTISRVTNPVVIYGWPHTNGVPVQPLYNGHVATYADYSHGIRLVQMAMTVDGRPDTVTNIWASSILHLLLSDEGVIATSRYITSSTSPRAIEK